MLMRLFLDAMKNRSVVLMLVGLFSSLVSLGNPGIVVGATYVLAKSQYPQVLKKHDPVAIYIVYKGALIGSNWRNTFFRGDTIINLKGFIDSTKGGLRAYRLIFGSEENIDSAWQMDNKFRVTDKVINLGNNIVRVFAYDSTQQVTDKFVFNYALKFKETGKQVPSLSRLLREEIVFTISDRNKFSVGAAWILSIGINRYEGKAISPFANCESDAISYNTFFKKKYLEKFGNRDSGFNYNEYLLTGKNATKEVILNALKDIAAKAAPNDFFVFNFSGFSNPVSFDSSNYFTYFFPYDVNGYTKDFVSYTDRYQEEVSDKLISLKVLQEHIQVIPAINQLFITEAGPTKNFKTEFIRMLMQNSPTVAGILNKNRVIIVPNGFGRDDIRCNDSVIRKGPINYFITSLDSTLNIYDLFTEGHKSGGIVFNLKNREVECRSFGYSYFDVFFEKQFLQQYNEIFGDERAETRGMKVKPKEMQQEVAGLTGKRYALVVGTDNYRGNGWKKLSNPIKDARAVADEFANSYGFEVQLLEDKPMDTIYKAIREYYLIAKPNDQLVIYFAGHGDVDDELLDDGFIVCSDSKSVDDDPVRNTYIPYQKLQKMLNNIPARQVLVLLDVCHGGVFDQKIFEKEKREGLSGSNSNKNVLQFLKDKLPLRTRKFLSSVGSEPAFDGKAGRHSPFANLLLQVLRAKGAGSNGIVTLTDIFRVLQTASMNETATLKISPAMADFGNVDAFSEFIFIPVEK